MGELLVKINDDVIAAGGLEGEATGHAHAINNTTHASLFANKEKTKLYIMITKPADLVHEEHKKIILPMGEYEVIRQREYHPKEIRRVAD